MTRRGLTVAPHAPQLEELLDISWQDPVQQADCVPVHILLQFPQCWVLVFKFVQFPVQQLGWLALHYRVLVNYHGQAGAVSLRHTAELHAPQFKELLDKSVQNPVQQAGCMPVHVLLQLPQCWALVLKLAQFPVQQLG